MNWTDEDIDKLFQESASQMNAPAFQESFWEEVEALLPQEKKKKGLGWIFGGTLTCFALIAAMILPSGRLGTEKTPKAAPAVPASVPALASTQQTPAAIVATASPATATDPVQASPVGTQRTASPVQQVGRSYIAHTPAAAEMPVALQPVVDHGAPVPASEAAPESASLTQEETTERLALLENNTQLPALEALNAGAFLPKRKNNGFYVQGGFGMAQSFMAGTERSWTPTVMLGGGYQFRPQGLGFSAGLNLTGSFANTLEITRKAKIYNFSSTSYEQNLAYRQLYSVELPVSLDFRKNRHTVSLGVAPTYLAGTVMRFSQFENGALSENGMYLGQRAGLNSFGMKAGIGYQLEIARDWNVGVQLSTQLMQQIDATQFKGEAAARLPLSGQIMIRKTITK